VLDAGEFLQDFGQIWRVATDEERKKLLGSTIDIAYILEGSIKAIKPKPSMYNLPHATAGRDQPDKSPPDVRLRSRRVSGPHDRYGSRSHLAPSSLSIPACLCLASSHCVGQLARYSEGLLIPLAYSAT